MNKREALKRWLLENRAIDCEARFFFPHVCEPGTADMHEVIYKRNDVPAALQAYLWSKLNVVLACHGLHIPEGQTRTFNLLALRYLARLYGWPALKTYAGSAPFKVLSTIDWAIPEIAT